MNYLKIYIQLCKKGKARTQTKLDSSNLYEKHHVFPLSIFGINHFIIKFTAREHYVAHKLLVRICEKRYGRYHIYTRKMALAVHKMVYRLGNTKKIIMNSTDYELARKCIIQAKIGKKRSDMVGKKYFGASDEQIRLGIQKMVNKKIGQSIPNYPKNRKSRGNQSESTKNKISNIRLTTNEKYVKMSVSEFKQWMAQYNLYMADGRKNSNITRAIIARNESIEMYYAND